MSSEIETYAINKFVILQYLSRRLMELKHWPWETRKWENAFECSQLEVSTDFGRFQNLYMEDKIITHDVYKGKREMHDRAN
jgi:hypothetical protein